MKANRYAMIAALVAVCAVPAFAQRGSKNVVTQFLRAKAKLQTATSVRIRPIAIAGVKNGQIVTPYYPIVTDNDWPNGPWSTIYDCIEISPAQPLATPPAPDGLPYENPAYGPAYMVPPNYGLTAASPGSRWYFGPTYENTFTTNDMDISPLYAGFDADRVAYQWHWNPINPTERMIINVSLTETFAATEAGLAPPMGGGPDNVSWSGFLDGVSLDYGDGMGAGIPAATYYDNVDLTTPPPPLKLALPVDGKGAYILQLLSNTTPPTLASRGQFFFWMAKQTNAALPGGNHSNQGINQWDDDVDITSPAPPGLGINNSDGRHFTNPPGPAHLVEFYEYPHTLLPIPLPAGATEPLGATFGLYSQFGAFTAATNADVQVMAGFPFGAITAGALRVAGGTANTILSDAGNSVGELQVNVATGGTTTDAMSFITRTKGTRTDVQEEVSVWDNSINDWFSLNIRNTTVAYSNVRVDLTTGTANFLSGAGNVLVRFTFIPTQDLLAADGWTNSVDRLTVFVKGVQSN